MATGEDPEHVDAMAAVCRDLGRVLNESRGPAEALPLLEMVMMLRTHLLQQNENAETLHDWAVALFPLCAAQVDADKLDDALENAGKAVDAYRTLVNIYGLSGRRLDLAAARHMRAYVLKKLKRLTEAREEEDRAIHLFRELAASGSPGEYAPELGRALAAAGEIEEASGNRNAAALLLEESAGLLESTVTGALTEQERRFRRTSFSTSVRRMIYLACRLDREGAPPPKELDGGGNTWAERAVYWTERSRARNLSDLMAAARQNPFGVSAVEYASYEQCGRELRDLDFRLREMEDGLATVPEAALADFSGRSQWPRKNGPVCSTASATRSCSFAKRIPTGPPARRPSQSKRSAIPRGLVVRPCLTLDVAPQGVMAVLVGAGGAVQGRVLEALQVDDVARWVTGWQAAETEYRELGWFDRDFEEKRGAWWNAIDTIMADIGARLWAPLRDWVVQATPANGVADPRLVLLPGVLLNGFPIHAAGNGASRLIDDFDVVFVPSIDVLAGALAQPCHPSSISSRSAIRLPAPAVSRGRKWKSTKCGGPSRNSSFWALRAIPATRRPRAIG